MNFKEYFLFILAILQSVIASTQTITTYAGTGAAGFSNDGEIATKAQLNNPYGVALDKNGNLYIVDNPNNRIRKVDAVTQVITTIVGLGSNGGNCPLSQAGLQNPRGIAFDKTGNLYISDASTCIRKVDFTAQTIQTIAGIRGVANTYGNVLGDNGPATKAYFDGAAGIAIDGAGNIFIADMGNNRIRKIDVVSGIITTFAGGTASSDDGTDKLAIDAGISQPLNLAFDSHGDLYIADVGHDVIRKIDMHTNIIKIIAGKQHQSGYDGDGKPATDAMLNTPIGIALDANDNIYITDCFNNRVRKIDSKTGIISTIAGTGKAGYAGDCGPAGQALLNWPWGITVDNSGQVYFTELNNHTVRKIADMQANLIVGSTTICVGDSIFLTALEPNGTWSSSNTNIADISASGIVKGVAAGTAVISYVVNQGGCAFVTSNHTVTINTVNEDAAILSAQDLCIGSASMVKTASSNGYWYSDSETIIKTDGNGNFQCLNNGTAILRYMVTATCSVSDKVSIRVHQSQTLYLGNDTTICKNQPLIIDAGTGFIKYNWNTNDTTQSVTINKAGIYSVKATDVNSCVSADSLVVVQALDPPAIGWPQDSSFCEGNLLVLTAPSNTKSIIWQDGTASAFYTVNKPGEYSLKATANNGCTNTATINIVENPLPVFTLGADTSLCEKEVLSYNFNLPNATYAWNDGSALNKYSIHAEGQYWVTVTQQSCSSADTISVNYKPAPVVNLGNDTTLCESTTKLLNVETPGATYRWQDGSTNAGFLINNTGKYFVTVSVDGCKRSDTIAINYNYRPFFTLGVDTFLCKGTQLKLSPGINTNANYLWQDGSTKPFFNVLNPGMYSVKAFNQCGAFTDSIKITSNTCELIMPSAFTPNGDGLNDIFRVKNVFPVKNFKMIIYNRWAQKVFESSDIRNGWNGYYKGHVASNDTYVWVISFISENEEKQSGHGTVTIIK